MAYGDKLQKLNPCSDALITAYLRETTKNARSLLDVACGRGDRLRMLTEAFPELRLYGADADGENVSAAAKNCAGAEIMCADAAELPYPAGGFDAVICECSFSLFSAPRRCAAEICRVLREGGVLLLGDLYAKRDASAAERIMENETVKTVYGREMLEQYFLQAGLQLERFSDRSGDLTQMLGQMLMDGTLCDCLGAEALMQMKKLGTGYGLWIFRK